VSQAIHVAATLGVADRLRDGPCGAPELATALAVDAHALYRLLRALAAVGVFHEDDQRRFSLTEMGTCLCSDAPESLRGYPETLLGKKANFLDSERIPHRRGVRHHVSSRPFA